MNTIKFTSILLVGLIVLEIQSAYGQLKGGKPVSCSDEPSVELDPWNWLDREYTDQDEVMDLCLRFFCNNGKVDIERKFWSNKCPTPENEKERKLYEAQAEIRASSPTPRPVWTPAPEHPDATLSPEDQAAVDEQKSWTAKTTSTTTPEPTTTTTTEEPQVEEEQVKEEWIDEKGKKHPYKYSEQSPDDLDLDLVLSNYQRATLKPKTTTTTTTTTTETPIRSSRRSTKAPSRIIPSTRSHSSRLSKTTTTTTTTEEPTTSEYDTTVSTEEEDSTLENEKEDIPTEEEEVHGEDLEPVKISKPVLSSRPIVPSRIIPKRLHHELSQPLDNRLSLNAEDTLRVQASSVPEPTASGYSSYYETWKQFGSNAVTILAWHIGLVFMTSTITVFICCRIVLVLTRRPSAGTTEASKGAISSCPSRQIRTNFDLPV